MSRFLKPLAGIAGLSALALCLAATGGAAHGTAASVSATPGYQNQLSGVAALSPTNVWAAGIHCPGSCGGEPQGARPLVVHWNGTAGRRPRSTVSVPPWASSMQ
jgi:hypothetical protein